MYSLIKKGSLFGNYLKKIFLYILKPIEIIYKYIK